MWPSQELRASSSKKRLIYVFLQGIERNKIDMLCGALGSPPPKYTWVDKDGIDATEKEGKLIITTAQTH